MFFKQIRYNVAKNRKDNGLFLSSLVVAIVAFYTLLSLENQDVMRYLKTIESDAVGKLMLLIPAVFIISLFFVFFLVYFAYRYQLNNRKKEFGLYLMLGMKRSKLFFMLLGETVLNTLMSLVIGLPIALFLTEGISLATVKLIGLGIIGHQVNISLSAVIGTAVGFSAIQMIAMIFLSSGICRKEPLQLLDSDSAEKQVVLSGKERWLGFVTSLILLSVAYVLGIKVLKDFEFKTIMLILVLGTIGTFQFFNSIGTFLGYRIKKKSPSQTGLFTFTGRQIQEHVIHEYRALAVSSLLLLMAISCISFGIGVAASHTSDTRSAEFSIMSSEEEVIKVLSSEENASLIDTYYPMYLSTTYKSEDKVSWAGFIESIKTQTETELRDNLIENLEFETEPYIISVSSYNELLESLGKKPIQLEENKVALYTSMTDITDFTDIISSAIEGGGYIEVNGQKRELEQTLYTNNVVTDRSITIYIGLIVSEFDYEKMCDSKEPYCWNVLLKQDIIAEKGLIRAVGALEDNLLKTDLEYESYINGMGRNLFYKVAGSYITIYLGVLFMVIANTVIGLKYLMQQRANQHRYITLLKLGANTNELCKSAKRQINTFFLLVLGLAVCSSIFAVWAMFTSFVKLPVGTTLMATAIMGSIAFVIMIIIELIYSNFVIHSSSQEIRELSMFNERKD